MSLCLGAIVPVMAQSDVEVTDSTSGNWGGGIGGDLFTPAYLSVTILGNNDELFLHITLKNNSDIYGMQFDINSSLDITSSASDVTLTERGQNLSVTINHVSDGILRMEAYCKNNQHIGKGDDRVMTIKLKPKKSLPDGEHNMTLNNITLSAKGMVNVYTGTDITVNYCVGYILGDVNGDGIITAQDASLVQQLVAKKITAATEGIVYDAADVNADGMITAQDASLIQQHVAKKIDISTINN